MVRKTFWKSSRAENEKHHSGEIRIHVTRQAAFPDSNRIRLEMMAHPSCHDEVMMEGEQRWKAHENIIRQRAYLGNSSSNFFTRLTSGENCSGFCFAKAS